jgi:hypothetical protein
MKRLLPGSIAAVLVCVSTAGAQNPRTIYNSPVNAASTSRIVDVEPKSPFREKQTPSVEVFDRLRALSERQKLMHDGSGPNSASIYPTQPASAMQPLPATSIVSPPQASQAAPQPALQTVACDCETPAKVPARNWRRLLVQEQCAAAREMFPRHAYQAPYGGAYYFRPYMVEQIGRQADIVAGWGGDRTNPYDNRFLQAIYPPRSE